MTDSCDTELSHLLGFHEINLTPAVRTAAVCWGQDGTQTGVPGEDRAVGPTAVLCKLLLHPGSGPVMATPHCHPHGV